jgi:hypothetical protein
VARATAAHGGRARYRDARNAAHAGQALVLCRTSSSTCSPTWRRNPPGCFTKWELLRDVWRFRSEGNTRTVGAHACRVRKKLGASGRAAPDLQHPRRGPHVEPGHRVELARALGHVGLMALLRRLTGARGYQQPQTSARGRRQSERDAVAYRQSASAPGVVAAWRTAAPRFSGSGSQNSIHSTIFPLLTRTSERYVLP